MRNGYNEPPLGLDNGQFYTIHVTALLSMATSFVCATIVIGYSLRDRKSKSFFERTKSERFVVYMGICDATFNVIHAAEHLQMVVTRNHVHPIQICRLHALMSMELGFAQVFLVLFIAVNIFTMMFLHRNISFGKYDWKLLLTVVLCPFLIGVSSLLANIIGPNGVYCLFDSVTARQITFYLTTLPMCLVFTNNAILYGLTLYRIRSETNRLTKTLGGTTASMKRTHVAAKNMVLFLISFFVQWWGIAVYGCWTVLDKGPVSLYIVSTFFGNAGGLWNAVVYILIRRSRNNIHPKKTTYTTNVDLPKQVTYAT